EFWTVTGGRAALFVNERLDIAMLTEADGVQLGETALNPVDARALLGSGALIGRSIHDVAGAVRAAQLGADFVIAGHIYDSASKAGSQGRGAAFLKEIVDVCPIPVIAIGGISPER